MCSDWSKLNTNFVFMRLKMLTERGVSFELMERNYIRLMLSLQNKKYFLPSTNHAITYLDPN